jgi:hypothetical protein
MRHKYLSSILVTQDRVLIFNKHMIFFNEI